MRIFPYLPSHDIRAFLIIIDCLMIYRSLTDPDSNKFAIFLRLVGRKPNNKLDFQLFRRTERQIAVINFVTV